MPTVEDVILLHDRVLARTGADEHGLRDRGILEGAVDRARFLFSGLEQTIHMRAAVLARGIAADHPFNGANHRTAAATVIAIYEMNGFRLVATNDQLFQLVKDLGNDRLGLLDTASWLRAKTRHL